MASPTFNSVKIFDSIDGSGNRFSEGVLMVDDYSKIRQRIHFNGENGDRYLTHGWPDRKWTFRGIVSAPTYEQLDGIFAAIEDVIDEADMGTGTYHALQDSFGDTWSNAQVHNLSILMTHITDGGYVSQIVVTGIIAGMAQNAGGESESSGE